MGHCGWGLLHFLLHEATESMCSWIGCKSITGLPLAVFYI